MKQKKTFFALLLLMSGAKLFSQSYQTLIVDSGAYFANGADYNTGEVFVVFDNNMISRPAKPDELPAEVIAVYPNPVIDILHFKTPEDAAINHVIIYSMDGRKLLEEKITKDQVDLRNLPRGTYLLKTDAPDSLTFKIIKQ